MSVTGERPNWAPPAGTTFEWRPRPGSARRSSSSSSPTNAATSPWSIGDGGVLARRGARAAVPQPAHHRLPPVQDLPKLGISPAVNFSLSAT